MCTHQEECNYIDRFSLTERLLMRIGWTGFMVVGIWGINQQDPLWAWIYAGYCILGFLLVVLPGICAHCPYPYERSTCLFLPPAFLKTFYPYRGPKISRTGKITSAIILIGIVVIPNFWLIHDLQLFALYWLFGLPSVAAIPLYYCRHCRHTGCPMNRAKANLK